MGLRAARRESRQAHKHYFRLKVQGATACAIASAKSRWNVASVRCRRIACAERNKFCSDWSLLWNRMQYAAPSKMWKTLRHLTSLPNSAIKVPLDDQWVHWSSQGQAPESVWTFGRSSEAERFVDSLRQRSLAELGHLPCPSLDEIEHAAMRMRKGRSLGYDGLSTDILCKMSEVVNVFVLLCCVVFSTCTYPAAWGIGLISSLLKPGKPADQASSLRGIRLLSRLLAWLGQIIDARLRKIWSTGPEQYGFRIGVGCLDAVFVLWSLVDSRIQKQRRLFVVFIDLRTALPSLNRSILIHRLFQCGVCLDFCRLIVAVFDATISIVRAGAWLGKPFLETLGVREGGVESPHLSSMYIGDVRQRLESLHPRLCKFMHVTISILLYADDAALPADSVEDLALSLQIFVEYYNEMHLFISTAKTYVVVFHNQSDNGVHYMDDRVFVDGQEVTLSVYGQRIKASNSFEYLGVVLHACGHLHEHIDSPLSALGRAINLLMAGLSRIPSFSHSFVKYLWDSLVEPVGLYGLQLTIGCEPLLRDISKCESIAGDRFLKSEIGLRTMSLSA